ncbi:MAG: HAMP domain-containing sensor histidine kinase [Desulfovibrionales bacterium]
MKSDPEQLAKIMKEGRYCDKAVLFALEQMAVNSDHQIHDELLKELVLKYAEAERELTRLNQLKNFFLGMAAHDMRNPLSAISGFSELLMEGDNEPELNADLAARIHDTSQEMLQLLNDLLDISHIESRTFKINKNTCNLSKLAEERISRAKNLADAKNTIIEARIPPDIQLSLDRERIAQVMDNLLSNAIKYSPPESVTKATLGIFKDDIRFSVIDQGPGIPLKEQHKLFTEFSKLNIQPTAGEKSTGLGLSIVKKIIQAHDGSVGVNSTPGQGSEFYFLIPLK